MNQRNRRRTRATLRDKPPKMPDQAVSQQPSRFWYWMGGSLLAAAAFLRLFELTLKPLHHDEGVNGIFLTNLFRSGYYHYDPANYHGPSLYYFGWIVTTINSVFYGKAGLSTFAIRLVTALFGIGVVWLLLCLRRQLGTFGALSAATLAAVSPGMVFFSRYFIHEILFVFFTLGIVVSRLRYRETPRPRDFLLATASAALLGTTKETWIITVGVWLIAIPCTALYLRLRESSFTRANAGQNADTPGTPRLEKSLRTPDWSPVRLYGTAAALFIGLWVVLYSSFFTNFPQGVYDSVLTFGYWFRTGNSSPHDYGWTKYLEWLTKLEMPALLLGALGIVIAFWRARERFAVFTAFWSLGILAAYSLVHYKTPWCALNIILPLFIMGGYGLQQLYQSFVGRWAFLPLVLAACVSLYQAVNLTFIDYDDDAQPYVYAHTNREFLSMVDEIDSLAARWPEGKQIGISIMSPEHWPLPWYLRDYPNAAYWGKVVDSSQPILVVHQDQAAEVDRTLGRRYRRIGEYDLRPGNQLFLYLRRDIQP
ncbi:MAG TPA: flippase activity-associated protein Agl23 [Terriglobales bacterium]